MFLLSIFSSTLLYPNPKTLFFLTFFSSTRSLLPYLLIFLFFNFPPHKAPHSHRHTDKSLSLSPLHIFHLSKTLPNSKGFFEIRYERRKLKRKKNREEKKKKQHRKRKRRRRRDAATYQHRGVEKTMGNLGKRETHQR